MKKMKRKGLHKALSLLLIAAMTIGMLTGCGKTPVNDETKQTQGGTENGETGNEGTSDYSEKVSIRMLSRDIYHNESQMIGEDEIVKYFEDKFNCDFEFNFVPSPNQTEVFEKLNMMLTVGDIPDIIEMRTDLALSEGIYESLLENDKILRVEEYLKENQGRWSNIEALVNDSESATYRSKDGTLAIIPRSFGTVDHGLIIRKDWLDELGLAIPETTDDLYNVLKAFVEKDPDGTKNVGMTLPNSWWFGHFYCGFVGSWNWLEQGDKYVNAMGTDGQKEAFAYLNKLYSEGLLDKEIFTMKGEAEAIAKFTAGLSGVTMMGVTYGTPAILETLQEAYPDAEICYANIKGPKAYCRMNLPKFFEGCVINKDAKDVDRILDMIDFILSPEGEDILVNGIEGIHYTKNEDGTLNRNKELLEQEGWEGRAHGLRAMFNVETVITEDFSSNYEDVTAFVDSLKVPGVLTSDPCYGVKTEAEKQVGSKPWDVSGKYAIGFITGDYNLEAEWGDFVDEFYGAGMQQIEDEVNSIM